MDFEYMMKLSWLQWFVSTEHCVWKGLSLLTCLQCLFEPPIIEYQTKRLPVTNTPSSMVTDEIVDHTSDLIVRVPNSAVVLGLILR
jgi:hypothetical protein